MKRNIILSILLMLLFCGQLSAQEKNARIAVLDFSAGTGISQMEIDGLSSIFNSYFSPNPEYSVVERTRVSRILEEQNIQVSSLTEKQRVKLSEILNVSVIVIGDVNIVFDQYNVDVRAVNAQTGEIIAKDGIEIKKNASYRQAMKTLAEKISPKIPVVYLIPKTEPKPEVVKVKIDNDPKYKPTGEYLRVVAGLQDISFSIEYNQWYTSSFMVGLGTGLGSCRRIRYVFYDDGRGWVENLHLDNRAIPIYLETELRTPRYKWSLFMNLKAGMYIPLKKGYVEGDYKLKNKPFLASLTIGGSWKNLNLGVGVTTGGWLLDPDIPLTASLSYNLPISTIQKAITKALF